MRERPTDDAVNAVFLRITPARAGKTSSTILSGHIQQDHPRSCGKDMGFPSDPRTLPGSPPLVRERRSVATVCRQSWGITPARAGKTTRRAYERRNRQDHPRSCGKDSRQHSVSWARLGSPPLVRERRKNRMYRNPSHGITPARAGKTDLFDSLSLIGQDHPRSCGKDTVSVLFFTSMSGSPPLVRERRRLADYDASADMDHPRSCGKD